MALPVAILAGLAIAGPDLPVTIGHIGFDEARQELTFETTAPIHVRLEQIGRRILLDIPDAHLARTGVDLEASHGAVRDVRALEVEGVPTRVRFILTLAPDAEPTVRVQQSAGMVFVSFGTPSASHGEQNSEVFPVVPAGPLPPLADLRDRPDHPSARQWTWAAPPAPSPTPTPQLQVLPPGPGPQPDSVPTPAPAGGSGPAGTRSFVMLKFEQSDAIEVTQDQQGAQGQPPTTLTETGYPTGPAEIEWRQWIGPYFGLGLDARYFNWTETGTLTLLRQQGIGIAQIGLRWPLPYVEPEIFSGAALRYESFSGDGQSEWAPMVGGGVRIQPLDALGLRLWGRDYPIGLGGDGFWSAGTDLLIDWGFGLASVGYTWDQIAPSGGGHATFGTFTVGLGVQY